VRLNPKLRAGGLACLVVGGAGRGRAGVRAGGWWCEGVGGQSLYTDCNYYSREVTAVSYIYIYAELLVICVTILTVGFGCQLR
jgi:hypothetical protein